MLKMGSRCAVESSRSTVLPKEARRYTPSAVNSSNGRSDGLMELLSPLEVVEIAARTCIQGCVDLILLRQLSDLD